MKYKIMKYKIIYCIQEKSLCDKDIEKDITSTNLKKDFGFLMDTS